MHQAILAGGHEHLIIRTGQRHDTEMPDEMLSDMGLPGPDVLIETGPGEPPQQVAVMLEALEAEINRTSPDWVLLYGDDTTTLAGAIAASKLRVKAGHIEAGVRTHDPRLSEEISRRVADMVCHLLFAPTARAMANLEREGLAEKARLTGDVMLDAFIAFSPRASGLLACRDAGMERPYILATFCRPENVDRPDLLRSILEGLQEVSEIMPVVFPIHPGTLKRVEEHGLQDYLIQQTNLRIIPPIGYLRSLSLLLDSELVITDSGGLQREAFFARKPCITLLDRTGWPETLEGGANRLLPRARGLAQAVRFIIENPPVVPGPVAFGRGRAGRLIVEALGEA